VVGSTKNKIQHGHHK